MFKRTLLLFICFLILLTVFPITRPIYLVKSAPKQVKILPIMLNFSDESHQRVPSEIHDFFFGTKPEDRSLRNYYMSVTNGTIEFVPGSYGVGDWITMPRSKVDYARGGSVSSLLRDAFEILATKGFVFDEYDQNHDGYIDYTIIVQSGDPEQGYSGSIFWLHYAPYELGTYVSDRLKVGQYNMTAEKFRGDKTAPLQGICHEFYHYQGGLDLYSYLYTRQYAVSNWDIMAENFNNFGMCGFSRAFLGWLKPIPITRSGVYEIDAIASDGAKRLYRVDIPGTAEYFLIENRQLVGVDAWWQGIPSTGLLFTHVDGAIPQQHRFNDGPNSYPHFAVWVEDGGGVKEKKDAVYCEDKKRTKFTMDTNPNTWDYNKKATVGINFTQISKSGMKMTFRVDFVYQEPHPAVDIDIIDFGKIQKGIKRAIPVTIRNEGVGTLSGRISSKDDWISFDPDNFSGNNAVITMIASADFIKAGKYRGKVEVKCKSGTVTIPTKVEVVDEMGDINYDGRVDEGDLAIFLPCYGTKKGEDRYDEICDFNIDDKIDVIDLGILAKNMR